jgi:8-oxo-dGTP pyrophosphatase MutT (NUDIX family)
MPKIVSSIIEVCIFKFEDSRVQYLLLQRTMREKVYPGTWQFVTGSIEEGERAHESALRELFEETGLKPSGFWVVPYISSFYEHRSDAVHLCPMFAAQVRVGAQPVLSSEHDAFEWCDFDGARRRLVWPGQREGLRIVQEYIVRGETAGEITKIL